MQFKKFSHRSDFIFTLTLFTVFLISSVILVLFGARIYQKSVSETAENRRIRTSLSYITEKIRQCDHQNSISVTNLDERAVLVLYSEYNQTPYATYIYWDNGYLKELFARRGLPFQPEAGSIITAVRDFSVTQDGSMVQLTVTEQNGTAHTAQIHPNAGQEESP